MRGVEAVIIIIVDEEEHPRTLASTPDTAGHAVQFAPMRHWAVLGVAAISLSSCFFATGSLLTVRNPPPAAIDAGVNDVLQAGVAEVDLTPPPGLPMYGYSTIGAAYSEGYWLRIRGRIIVLQSGPTRLALMQLDLGAASGLLHRKIAERLAPDGLGPQQLVMATVHTHGGPGGFFGDKFYNHHVAGRPGFDERFVDFMADALAGGAREAITRLRPARLAFGQLDVPHEASSNRSLDAWQRNFDDGSLVPPDAVDHTLTMMRVDLEGDDGLPHPAATWSTYAVHSNSMPANYKLLHGDIHGATSRLTARKIEATTGVSGFVAATTNGAEGDVGAGTEVGKDQGSALTMKVSELISDAAVKLFHQLDDAIAEASATFVPISIVYEEASMRGANTASGRLCPSAFLGGPQIGGSEEGHGLDGFLAVALKANEGAVTPPHGCTATKVRFIGGIQDLFVEPDDMPDLLPFQLVTLGPKDRGLALASFPGEPTTQIGRRVKAQLAAKLGWTGPIAVLGLTNSYATYFTTGAEYLAQDYEGGATLYGGFQGQFAVEEFGRLATTWKPGEVKTLAYDATRVFRPGQQTALLPTGPACRPETWLVLKVDVRRPISTFTWRGFASTEQCALPKLRVECGGVLLRDERGLPQSDDGFQFEVRVAAGDRWTASWKVQGTSDQDCVFVIDAGGTQVRSQPFKVNP